ncbi:MAG: hypothetical protein JXR69_03475 [Candidatus Delongbacteria bacterium]|nr:hypothetical protein [Candidatus Delongbacteria bacterium]
MKFRRIVLVLTISLLSFTLFNCGSKKEASSEQTLETKKVVKDEIDLKTQEGYEKVITSLGITIFENSELKELKKSDFYGNEVIEYTIPVGEGTPFADHKAAEDSLKSFYKAELEAKLIPDGWNKSIGGDENRMMFIKTGGKVKMFTVSIFPSMAENDSTKKTYLFNYSD